MLLGGEMLPVALKACRTPSRYPGEVSVPVSTAMVILLNESFNCWELYE